LVFAGTNTIQVGAQLRVIAPLEGRWFELGLRVRECSHGLLSSRC
jgi:hypothetical protein